MNIRYRAAILQRLILILCALGGTVSGYGQGRFIQNLGQWDSSVISRAGIKSGAIYLLKDQVRYNFVNARDIAAFHADPYHTDTLSVHGQALFMKWIHASPDVQTGFVNQYPEYYNYYLGNDPKQWQARVHAYSEFNYTHLYPGIDLNLNAESTDLEYTYTIQPGANPSAIQVLIQGAEGVFVRDSDLHINTPLVNIIEKSPFAYQYIGDMKVQVPCSFKVSAGNIESFTFPKGYDTTRPLIIDPVVIFSTYSGSTADNWGFTATYDALGDGYSGGVVFGAGFPVTSGAYQVTFKGGTTFYANINAIDLRVMGFFARDIGILKYSPDGKHLLFATYLGGKKGNEQPHSMVVDKSGSLIVMGTTASSDFPVTSAAYGKTLGGKTDLFVSRFSSDGTKLLASTFMGGSGFDGLNGLDSTWLDTIGAYIYFVPYAGTKLFYNYGDQFRGEVVSDSSNNIYVASSTMSSDFPTTTGSYQPKFGGGKQDGIAFKLDSNLHNLVWSTYLGGSQDDAAYSIQLDGDRNPFICGGTLSSYFFPAGPSYQKANAGDVDGYICHLRNDGAKVLKATFLGTSKYDQTYFVQLDQAENVYVYGQTESTGFPVLNVNYHNAGSGNFITKFNNGLDSIMFSTVFGSGKGKPDISPTAFLVDNCNKVYISGWGGKLFYPLLSRLQNVYNMPVTPDAFQTNTTDSAAFYVAVFEKGLDTLLYGSYFGDSTEVHVDGGTSRFDKNGIMYQSVCAGCGGYSDFPTTPGAWSRTNNSSNCNNLLFKVDLKIPTLTAGAIAPQFGCRNVTLHFVNTSSKATGYLWDFGDSSARSTAVTPTHYYQHPGDYIITLVASNPNSCEVTDTFRTRVTIYTQAKAAFNVLRDSCSLKVRFIQTGESSSTSWHFGDGSTSDSVNGIHTYAGDGAYVVKLLVDSGTSCVDSFSKTIRIIGLNANFSYSFDTCNPLRYHFTNKSTGSIKVTNWLFPFLGVDTSYNADATFSAPGTYTVKLLVTDSAGCSNTIQKTITVDTLPRANFRYVLTSCTRKLFFQSLSTGAPAIKWVFSDGTTDTADTLTRTFDKDSFVKILFIVNPGLPCADTMKKTISFSAPVVDYQYYIDTCTGTVHFTNAAVGAARYLWKFDAKDSSTQPNPDYVYQTKGIYPVKLMVTSSAGCPDSVTHLILINEDANNNLFIPNIFTPNGDPYNNTFKVTGLNKCYTYDISIYNRWGQLYYHGSGTQLEWDGYTNHILVPEGVYYYVFHGKEEGELKGTITVLY